MSNFIPYSETWNAESHFGPPTIVFDTDEHLIWQQNNTSFGPVTDFEILHYGGVGSDARKLGNRALRLIEVQRLMELTQAGDTDGDSITTTVGELFDTHAEHAQQLGIEDSPLFKGGRSTKLLANLAEQLARTHAFVEVKPVVNEDGKEVSGGSLLSVAGNDVNAEITVTRSPIVFAFRDKAGRNQELFQEVDARNAELKARNELTVRGHRYRKKATKDQLKMFSRFEELDETVFGWQESEAWEVEAGERTFLLGFENSEGNLAAIRTKAVAQAIELFQVLEQKQEYAEGVSRSEFREFLTYAVAISNEGIEPNEIKNCVEDALYLVEFLQYQEDEEDESIITNEYSVFRISSRIHDLQINRYKSASDADVDETKFRDPAATYVPPFLEDTPATEDVELSKEEVYKVNALLEGTDSSEQTIVLALTAASSKRLAESYRERTGKALPRRKIVEAARDTTMSAVSLQVALENRWLSPGGSRRNIRGLQMTAGQPDSAAESSRGSVLGPLFVVVDQEKKHRPKS